MKRLSTGISTAMILALAACGGATAVDGGTGGVGGPQNGGSSPDDTGGRETGGGGSDSGGSKTGGLHTGGSKTGGSRTGGVTSTGGVGNQPNTGGRYTGGTGGIYTPTGGIYTPTGGITTVGGMVTGGVETGGRQVLTGGAGTPTTGGWNTGGVVEGGAYPTGGAVTTGGTPTGGAPPGCELVNQWIDPYYFCNLGYECADGFVDLSCNGSGADGWWCYCNNPQQYFEYRILGSTDDACKYIDLCADSIEFTGPKECYSMYASNDETYCSIERECGQVVELGDGISAASMGWYSTSCSLYGDDWRCSCSEPDDYVEFAFPGSADPGTTCQQAETVCDAAPLVPSGPKTCTPISLQAPDSTYCSTEQLCTQTATVGDLTVDVRERLLVSCFAEDTGWDCSCDSDGESVTIRIDSPSSWQACPDAAAACVAAMPD